MKQQNENEESNAVSVSVQSDRTFLATEPIGKLLAKLALPTIAAQLINMLYNIVDRIYIGHIPDTGAMALTGVGVCMPLIMIITAFAALVGNGGAPRATIFMGKNKKDDAEKILANCFTMQILLSIVLTVVLLIWNRDFLLAFGASANTIEYLCTRNDLCSVDSWHECVYHSAGFCEGRHALRIDWRNREHYIGSDLYLRTSYGCPGSCTCNSDFPMLLLHLGNKFSVREADNAPYPRQKYGIEGSVYSSVSGTRI